MTAALVEVVAFLRFVKPAADCRSRERRASAASLCHVELAAFFPGVSLLVEDPHNAAKTPIEGAAHNGGLPQVTFL